MSFNKILVIGVAGNYNSRAQFERAVASRIRAAGATASAFYSVVPGNDPISREVVLAAVRSGDFDAVLLTRIVGQQENVKVESGTTETKASTVGGRPINFFRYDYEELNEPKSISITTTVTLSSELFSAADEAECFAYGRAKGLDVYFKQGHYDDVCDPLKWDKESRRDRR